MSNFVKTVSEYLDLVKNGIKNRDKIIEGLWTAASIKEGNGNITPEAVAEIMKRDALCDECSFNSKNAAVLRNYSSPIFFDHCIFCKCQLGEGGKTYCLSCNCGMLEWNKRNPHLPQMTLKWTEFVQPDKINQ